jgi:dihydroorotate dehydrogenase electron transfer subunit
VMAWLPRADNDRPADTRRPSDEKPFSLSGVHPIALTVDRVGPFTSAMHGLSAGSRLWLRGPFGQGFSLCPGPLLLISGGCGAAPLLYLAQVARQGGRPVSVVLGARTAVGLLYRQQFGDLGCAVHVTTDDGTAGQRGTALDRAASLLDAGLASADTLYACGPEPMLEGVYRLAQAHGLPCQLSYEAYMRCAIGVCGSCARGGRLVCRDGPVFDRPPSMSNHPTERTKP